MSQENVEVARACVEAFDRHDLAAAAATLDPNVEWDSTVLIDEEPIQGRDAVRAYWQRISSTFPFAHENHRFIEAGDQVCILADIRIQGAGSGVELAQPCGYAMTVRNGAIVQARFFPSHEKALKAVGLPG